MKTYLTISNGYAKQWEADLEIIKLVYGITHSTQQAIMTAVRQTAIRARNLSMLSGESTRIFQAEDGTWTLQVGDDVRNVVEGLDSPEHALDLVIGAN